jgi:hypothetical protein
MGCRAPKLSRSFGKQACCGKTRHANREKRNEASVFGDRYFSLTLVPGTACHIQYVVVRGGVSIVLGRTARRNGHRAGVLSGGQMACGASAGGGERSVARRSSARVGVAGSARGGASRPSVLKAGAMQDQRPRAARKPSGSSIRSRTGRVRTLWRIDAGRRTASFSVVTSCAPSALASCSSRVRRAAPIGW